MRPARETATAMTGCRPCGEVAPGREREAQVAGSKRSPNPQDFTGHGDMVEEEV